MERVTRYHPILVAVHWFLAIAITGSLVRSLVWMARTSNSDPSKLGLLRTHMTAGMVIVALMGIRLAVRTYSKKPAALEDHPSLRVAARLTHITLYVLVFGMGLTGLTTALLSGAFAKIYFNRHIPLPSTFAIYPSRQIHAVLAWMLIGLIALHFGAAFYHQFGKHDRIFKRMWFGRRTMADPLPQARMLVVLPNPRPITVKGENA